ncbi:hypothetical protein JCM3765_007713 [Sporobolomyces pararoseus]
MDQPSPPPPVPSFTRPLIHTITTPDLETLLSSSSNLNSISSLLYPFSSSCSKSPTLNNVQIRTPPNHEPRIIKHFSIEFKEKLLPLGWDTTTGGGVGMRRQGSNNPSNNNMSQGEKDELYLDQLSEKIIKQTTLSASPPPPEIKLDPTNLYPKKQQYDLQGNKLDPSTTTTTTTTTEEEWENKTLDDLTPWYKLFRQQVFKRREMVEFETWGWPVGCILALSTNHPDPLNAISLLWDLTSPNQLYSSSSSQFNEQEFVNPDILRYILIIHDMRTTPTTSTSTTEEEEGGGGGGGGGRGGEGMSWEQVLKLEETVKKTYGVHTKVLTLYDHYKPLKSPAELKLEQEGGGGGGVDLEKEIENLWPTSFTSEEEETHSGGESLIGLGYSSSSTSPTRTLTTTTTHQKNKCFSLKDLDSLSLFVREFVTQSLIPHLERTITLYHEQFNSSKKSLGGRLFSVGRKYFGGASSNNNSPSVSQVNTRAGSPVTTGTGTGGGGIMGYNSNRGYYSFQSLESQTRRLGDLLFMFLDFKLSGQVYGEVSKDFKNDRALKHFSSAIRMQGLCQLLLTFNSSSSNVVNFNGSNSNSPEFYLQSSIIASSNSNGSVDFDLLRSTMLYHYYYSLLSVNSTTSRLSSNSLMRLVDLSRRGGEGDEDELWTAMICEQSALSQLGIINNNKLLIPRRRERRERKFVLEMCLAGIRYEKSGLKSISRRCLSQASTLYSSSSSSTSSNSIGTFLSIKTYLHHSLARQAYNASKPLDAIYHFLKLLPSTTTTSGEVEVEGGSLDWLDDFSLAWELLGTTSSSSNSTEEEESQGLGQIRAEEIVKKAGIELGIRLFDSNKVEISRRVSSFETDGMKEEEEEGEKESWIELEKAVLMTTTTKGGRTSTRVGGAGGAGGGELKSKLLKNQTLVGEIFYLELPIRNPLEAFLSIGDLTVQTDNDEEEDNTLETQQSLDGKVIELAPLESRIIYIPMKSLKSKTFQFRSISYKFHNLLPVFEPLSFSSRKLLNSKNKKTNSSLEEKVQFPTVEVLDPIPILSIIEFEDLPQRLLHGQSETRKIKLKNIGQVTIKQLRGICSNPEIARFFDTIDEQGEEEEETLVEGGKFKVNNTIRNNQASKLMKEDDDELKPQEEIQVEISLRGHKVGEKWLKWLFVFESPDGETFSTRFKHKLEISPSLEFRYSTRPSSQDQYPFVLDIEAYNSGIPTEDLCITSISTLSPFWKVSSLLPTNTNEKETFSSNPIRWQQISNLVLAIDKVENGLEQCKKSISWSVEQISGLLQGKKIEENQIGEVELNFTKIGNSSLIGDPSRSNLVKSILNSHSHERSISLSNSFPTIPLDLLPFLFPLFSPSSTLILLEYSSPSLDLKGTHFLSIPNLGTTSSSFGKKKLEKVLKISELKSGGIFAESQLEKTLLIKNLRQSSSNQEFGGGGLEIDPSIVFLKVEDQVCREHDFSKGPCLVPIHFLIRNLSPTSSFDYVLTLGTTTDSALVYTGLLTRRNKVGPLSISKVSTTVFITREGIYDVGGWKLELKLDDDDDDDDEGGGGKVWKIEGEKRELRVGGRR